MEFGLIDEWRIVGMLDVSDAVIVHCHGGFGDNIRSWMKTDPYVNHCEWERDRR